MISVVILGAGNVGTHLVKAVQSAKNLNLVQWYCRDPKAIQWPVKSIELCHDVKDLKMADVYMIAVSDKAVSELSKQLPFENRLVVHTSGSVALKLLDMKHRRGVFYPLQTFSATSELDFSEVPFCIETMEKEDTKLLKTLAASMGSPFYMINTEQRQALHLSAVFVNNFTNQLYRIAHELTDFKAISFDVLKPLILETAKKIQQTSPYSAQTGPAKRNDQVTINHHLRTLESHPDYQSLYDQLTNSIKNTHGYKKL
ncbi:MAG: Uncharacterised protein [Formosa sp. Hel1_33_131]|nr:MAG: Uncharacterised protein [Formosa sp. Hel1_33_131]|tara:strand:+ start:1458 stop:2228 length:771 start_codon:yes stop_codon:yes gene_type:complete